MKKLKKPDFMKNWVMERYAPAAASTITAGTAASAINYSYNRNAEHEFQTHLHDEDRKKAEAEKEKFKFLNKKIDVVAKSHGIDLPDEKDYNQAETDSIHEETMRQLKQASIGSFIKNFAKSTVHDVVSMPPVSRALGMGSIPEMSKIESMTNEIMEHDLKLDELLGETKKITMDNHVAKSNIEQSLQRLKELGHGVDQEGRLIFNKDLALRSGNASPGIRGSFHGGASKTKGLSPMQEHFKAYADYINHNSTLSQNMNQLEMLEKETKYHADSYHNKKVALANSLSLDPNNPTHMSLLEPGSGGIQQLIEAKQKEIGGLPDRILSQRNVGIAGLGLGGLAALKYRGWQNAANQEIGMLRRTLAGKSNSPLLTTAQKVGIGLGLGGAAAAIGGSTYYNHITSPEYLMNNPPREEAPNTSYSMLPAPSPMLALPAPNPGLAPVNVNDMDYLSLPMGKAASKIPTAGQVDNVEKAISNITKGVSNIGDTIKTVGREGAETLKHTPGDNKVSQTVRNQADNIGNGASLLGAGLAGVGLHHALTNKKLMKAVKNGLKKEIGLGPSPMSSGAKFGLAAGLGGGGALAASSHLAKKPSSHESQESPEDEKQEHLTNPSESEDQMYPASQEEQDKLIEQFSRKQASINDIKNLFLARAMQSAPGVASASLNISNDALRNMGYMAAGASIPIAADLAWTEAKRRAAKALQPELYNQPGVGGSGWPKYQ